MRERIILEELTKSVNYLSLEYFAKLMKVSSRTIYNEIKCLMKNQKKNGFEIFLKRGEGYQIKINNQEIFNKYIKNEFAEFESDPINRIENIIAILLLKDNYITMEFLAEELNFSRSIIKSEMKKVEEYLNEREIGLIKKAHYGIRVVGNNLNIDLIIAELYLNNNEIIKKKLNLDAYIENYKNLEKTLIDDLKNNHLDTNYTELKQIDAFLKTLIYKCKLKDLNISENKCAIEDSVYKTIALNLSEVIEEKFKIKFFKDEIENLIIVLKKKTKVSRFKLGYETSLVGNINKFLKDIDKEYNMSFCNDKDLKKSLLQHVSLLIDRLHDNVYFSNPLTNEISIKYAVSFNIAIKFCKMIEKTYNVKINQDEIAFITTYFAVYMEKESQSTIKKIDRIAIICSSGGGSAYLIKLKLETVFNYANIQTFSLLNMDEVRNFEPNIIFTITKLQESFNVPIIYISELLDDLELLKIKNTFRFKNEIKSSVSAVENEFMQLFKNSFFNIINDTIEYLDILKIMANQIEKEGYSEKGYRDYVLEREKFLSTIYLNGITIPHPINMCGKKNIISIAIIKNKIKYENKSPKIIFMVSLMKGQLELHKKITFVLNKLMDNENLVNELSNSNTYEEFIIKLNELRV